jgi:hypothetical protein
MLSTHDRKGGNNEDSDEEMDDFFDDNQGSGQSSAQRDDQSSGQSKSQGDDNAAEKTVSKKKKGPRGDGKLPDRNSHILTIPRHPKTIFDDEYFLNLLEGSISLTLEQKQEVINAIPRLEQDKIDELVKIFLEEREKFAELEGEFKDDVVKLKRHE